MLIEFFGGPCDGELIEVLPCDPIIEIPLKEPHRVSLMDEMAAPSPRTFHTATYRILRKDCPGFVCYGKFIE
jgi:hypothetical protein